MAHFTDITVRDANGATFIDVSRYHDLDHPFLSCVDRVTHARLWWSYRGEEIVSGAVIGTLWRLVMCARSRHWWLPTLDLDANKYGSVCAWCEARA